MVFFQIISATVAVGSLFFSWKQWNSNLPSKKNNDDYTRYNFLNQFFNDYKKIEENKKNILNKQSMAIGFNKYYGTHSLTAELGEYFYKNTFPIDMVKKFDKVHEKFIFNSGDEFSFKIKNSVTIKWYKGLKIVAAVIYSSATCLLVYPLALSALKYINLKDFFILFMSVSIVCLPTLIYTLKGVEKLRDINDFYEYCQSKKLICSNNPTPTPNNNT